jgi:hypothetical protein
LLRIEPLIIDTGCICEPFFVDSDPADCSIDPRQPSEPDGNNPAGPSSVVLTSTFDTLGMTCAHFLLSQVPTGPPPITCQSVTPRFGGVNEQILVSFDRRITPMGWTCIVYAPGGPPQGETFCQSHFPGDMDQSRTVQPLDMDRLVDCLSDDPSSCPLAKCDIDRSGVCTGKDLLRLADLMNGGDFYPAYRGLTMPECPTAP